MKYFVIFYDKDYAVIMDANNRQEEELLRHYENKETLDEFHTRVENRLLDLNRVD